MINEEAAFLGFMEDLLGLNASQLAQAFAIRPNRSQAYFLQVWKEDAEASWQMALQRSRQAQTIF